jgi:hypothetical protein
MFSYRRMVFSRNTLLRTTFAVIVSVGAALAGCYVGYKSYTEHYTAADTALGEEHTVNYPPSDTLELTEDALRGDGILFELQPDNSIITLWRDADVNTPTQWFDLIVPVEPRYRYEIQIEPEGSHKSKILVNVRTESIPDESLQSYKASARFDLFKEIDELASKFPPPSRLPTTGGVNFTLLPNEDLKSLAKRVTGNENNWHEIAKDNGLTSAADVTPFENIWVRNSLLKQATH